MVYWVYLLANKSRMTYVGMTRDLTSRFVEHKIGMSRYVAKYQVNRLVYLERQPDQFAAARREKQIKGWRRSKKHSLIESVNPKWTELAQLQVIRSGKQRPRLWRFELTVAPVAPIQPERSEGYSSE